jgi:hypothetical protein
MILDFNGFGGRIKNNLEKEEVIELVNLITNLKPNIPSELNTSDVSKLVDNINYYVSECGNYKIIVLFRESDRYINNDGSITYGNFRSLFKVTITSEFNLKIKHLKDYILLTSDIISKVYENSEMVVKFNDSKVRIKEFEKVSDDQEMDKLSLIIRIK